jgi:hypothetical protein
VRVRVGFFFIFSLFVINFIYGESVLGEIAFGEIAFNESVVSLRVAPVVEESMEFPNLNTGFGVDINFDWAFWNITNKINLGVSAGGSYLNIPIDAGDPLVFFDGKAGPFVQYRPFDRWSFQGGINVGVYQFSRGEVVEIKAAASVSLGVDFHILPYLSLFAGGGYIYRVFTENMPISAFNAALGLRVNLSELMAGRTRINVEKSEQYRIFPVSWSWYENNPVAAVNIINEEPNSITDVNMTIFLDSFMGQPWTFATLPRLASGSSATVPVTALFNEVMLSLTENVIANGEIHVQYKSLGVLKESVFPLQMPVFHRNTLSWEDDRRAAAFVSPRDSSARMFARYVENAVDLFLKSGYSSPALARLPQNVIYAAALFEALRLYGISYVVVPTMSFVNMKQDEAALDNVTFPYETLYYRSGDCTYLSILYCSLLEALSIETAFITIPGHLYMAFEVGDDEWLAGSADIIELETDGVRKRWLPVEITVPEEGFIRAWRIGAREWRNSGEDAALFRIRECWEVYPSVTITASIDYPPEMPPGGDIVFAMDRELVNFLRTFRY